MKKELKDKWLKALRGGQYKQGRKFLRTFEEKFCCLGILALEAGLEFEENASGSYMACYSVKAPYKEGPNYIAILGYQHRPILGLTATQENHLILMNDGGKTFEEIADWIEINIGEEN